MRPLIWSVPMGGEIHISGRREGDSVVVRVSDAGPGIPDDVADSIYDPFFTTKENGTGLGLPTAYQIVAQHGGELKLETTKPGGACFAFTLPVLKKEAA
jgi:two-component system sensor histidine kinase HupT/HoxJ